MLTPANSSSLPPSGDAKGSTADNPLPTAGRELAATVRSVASSGTNGEVFRIQVEANSRLLELTTRAPLQQGDRILLQRGSNGELQIRLPSQAQPAPASTPQPAANNLLLQVASADGARLQQLLPLNLPRNAQVTGSEPLLQNRPANPPPASGAPTQAGSAVTATVTTNVTTTGTATAPGGNTTPGDRGSAAPPTQTGASQAAPVRSETGAAQNTRPPGPVANIPPPGAQATATASAQPQAAAASAPGQAQVYSAQLQSLIDIKAAPAASSPPGSSATPGVGAPASTASPTPTQQAQPQQPPQTQQQPQAQGQTPAATQTPVQPTPATGGQPAQPSSQPSSQPSTQPSAQSSTQPPPSAPNQGAPTATSTESAALSRTGQALLQTLGKQAPAPAIQQHLVRLNIDSQTLNLISPKPLLSGQQVVLTRVTEQQVNLQPQSAPATPLQQSSAQLQMQQALREALPRQIPFADALNQLVQLSQSPAGRSQGAIGQLVQSMLSMFSVTPGSADAEQAIQRNLQQGGLLTESRLAQGGSPAERSSTPDLKQQLGQLLKAAEQLPANAREQMTRLVEALQARSTSQQVSSLQGWKEQPDGTQERVYRLDLPIRQAEQHDNAELTITEERRRNTQGELETLWGVALHFNLEQHGSVDARLSLSEGWRLQVQFWAEQAATLRQIERRLNDFSDGLHRKGFLVETLHARQGRPSQPELTDVQRRLVDIHT